MTNKKKDKEVEKYYFIKKQTGELSFYYVMGISGLVMCLAMFVVNLFSDPLIFPKGLIYFELGFSIALFLIGCSEESQRKTYWVKKEFKEVKK